MKSVKTIIYIFSSSRFFADTLSFYLSTHNDIVISGISGNVNEYDKIAQLLRIDITVIISHHPDFLLFMLKQIEQIQSTKNILIIAPEEFLERTKASSTAHHIEFVSFDQKQEAIVDKLNSLTDSKRKNLKENSSDILKNISFREKEILSLIKKGKKTKEIAEELYLSVKTVENHRNNILKKTKSKSMITLINELYKLGLFGVSNSLVFKIQNFQFDSFHNHFSSVFHF